MSNEIPNNLYQIAPLLIKPGMEIWTDDDENGYGITKFRVEKVYKKPEAPKDILVLECINSNFGTLQKILINLKNPRNLFTGKLYSEWRQI